MWTNHMFNLWYTMCYPPVCCNGTCSSSTAGFEIANSTDHLPTMNTWFHEFTTYDQRVQLRARDFTGLPRVINELSYDHVISRAYHVWSTSYVTSTWLHGFTTYDQRVKLRPRDFTGLPRMINELSHEHMILRVYHVWSTSQVTTTWFHGFTTYPPRVRLLASA